MVKQGLWLVLFTLLNASAGAESSIPVPQDYRQLISMPPESLAMIGADMRDHMAALSEITGLLAQDKLTEAAEVAETKLGRSSMGKYRGSEFAPGMHMSPAMRSIAWAMHDAGSELADVAKQGDRQATLLSFQKLQNTCVACHQSFRAR